MEHRRRQDLDQGEQAQVGGDGVITITYHGVDNVGIVSANQTIEVKVASTPPTVTAQNASAKAGKQWKNPTITFNITAVTPTATAIIQIRTLSGKTISTHHYANVATGQDVSKTFTLNTAQGRQVQHPRRRQSIRLATCRPSAVPPR